MNRKRTLLHRNILLPLFIFFSFCHSSAQVTAKKAQGSTGYIFRTTDGSLVADPNELLSQPQLFLTLSGNEVIPENAYTAEHRKFQRSVNDREDLVRSLNPISDKIIFKSKQALAAFQGKDIDFEEITPYTWKWITLQRTDANGDTTLVKLRRPNWWLNAHKATLTGSKVQLSLPEMGVSGEFLLTKISISQYDSRFHTDPDTGLYKFRPVTGWFSRSSSDVWNYYFSGGAEPLQVTLLHPFYSLDRQDYVAANELRPNERIRSADGGTVFLRREKKEGREKVYNLEIWRDHNFMVGQQGLLVHNSCGQGAIGVFSKLHGPAYADFKSVIEALPDEVLFSLSQLDAAALTSLLTKFKNEGSLFDAFKADLFKPEFREWVKANGGKLGAWEVLHKGGRSTLKTKISALEALSDLLVPEKHLQYNISADLLGKMNGWNGAGFEDVCKKVKDLFDNLPPPSKVQGLDKYLGNAGFGNSSQYTARHSWVQLEGLLQNKPLVKNADVLKFENDISITINGQTYSSVTDVMMKYGGRQIEIETKAGEEFFTFVDATGSNFSKQSFNSLNKVNSLEDYKVLLSSSVKAVLNATSKQKVINAWKNWQNGLFMSNPFIQNVFKVYRKKIAGLDQPFFDAQDLEDFLISNNDWFNEIFKNGL